VESVFYLQTYWQHFEVPEEIKKAALNISSIVFDFDGVFTSNSVFVTENGLEMVECSRLDGFGLTKMLSYAIKLLVVSTEKNPVVKRRCEKLNIECFSGIDDKLACLKSWAERERLNFENILYMGNDINDIPCLQVAGLSVAVPDAHPSVFEYSNVVTSRFGGRGAVREICDFISGIREEKW
jgi:YrbI family 3-deoxy-D-manno-octulosonate 8-phosphate phosphatase